jgi:hypothetical protein
MSPSVRDSSLCTCHSPNETFLSAKLWYREHSPYFQKGVFRFFLVRPEFTDTLAIKSGRHPVLETVQSAGTLVSNDIYCSDAARFHIVQGPKCVSSIFIVCMYRPAFILLNSMSGTVLHAPVSIPPTNLSGPTREKYISASNGAFNSDGNGWLFCPC